MDVREAAQAADRIAELNAEIRALAHLPPRPRSDSLEEIIDSALETVGSGLALTQTHYGQRIAELICGSLALQLRLQQRLTSRRSHMAATLTTSLRTLTNSTDTRNLPRLVCDELVSVAQFSAALYSAVESGYLHPLGGTSGQGAVLSLPREPIEVPVGTVEYDCITGSTAPLISNRTTSCTELSEMLRSSTYMVIPIVVDGMAVAVVHLAPEPPFGIDTTDVDVAEMYQAAVAAAVTRDIAHARVDRQRKMIERTASEMISGYDNSIVTGLEIVSDHDGFEAGATHHPQAPLHNPDLESQLTVREVEILRMMVTGASNAEISDQFLIGRETVKTHVQRILRKIGAINRSEAITLYLGQPR
jgi:DNA-binding CsgD family transcriptional regulator